MRSRKEQIRVTREVGKEQNTHASALWEGVGQVGLAVEAANKPFESTRNTERW